MKDSRAVSKVPTESHFTRILRPVRAAPADVVRPTRAEIDLAALRHNFARLAQRSRSPVWPVIKADGYGHGGKAIARTLERAGAKGFCVALVEEALELRDAGVFAPVLVMGGYYVGAWAELIARNITPVVTDAESIEALAAEARHAGQGPVAIHLKVDTGMSRLGVSPKDLAHVARAIVKHPTIRLEGLMTHFASADTDEASVAEQMARFRAAEDTLAAAGLVPELRHAANTAALVRDERTHLDFTRPGLGIFGVDPVADTGLELRPVMKVRTQIVALRQIEKGSGVGYGGTWRAERSSTIATVPMGYADGLSRSLSNSGSMLVHGRRAPIVGAISMDLTTLDVTGLDVRLGDEVVVLGSQTGRGRSATIHAAEIATQMGSIPWEVLTNISRRVPRFYRER